MEKNESDLEGKLNLIKIKHKHISIRYNGRLPNEDDLKRQYLLAVYNLTEQNISETARILRLSRQTIYTRLKEYEIIR